MSAESLPLRRTLAMPAGLGASVALHVVAIAAVLAFVSRPPPAQIIDLSDAVPVIFESLPRPEEQPKPEPPKPKPETPRPVPTPEVIETTAAETPVETPPPLPEPVEEPPPAAAEPPPAAQPSYQSLLKGILEQTKRYPRDALLSGAQGTVLVWFIVNREGTILAFRIERSSRSSTLDAEVRRMLKRIGRFPPLPVEEFGERERQEFLFEVDFRLLD